MQTIQPGLMGKQQQQAALAFEQAQKEGATAEQEWRSRSRTLSLREALTLAKIPVPAHLWAEKVARGWRPEPPQEPLRALTAA